MSMAPDSGSGLSSSSLTGIGGLVAGGAGLAAILGEGESPLPSEFSTLTNNQVPALTSEASTLQGEGQQFYGQGSQALQQAQEGILTQPQQAQLQQFQQGLTNTADQTYASMGRNANQDTSFISTSADIDAKVNAMAQQQIQSTIALGLGETSAGNQYSSTALGFQSAADQALISAGTAQVQLDTNYSQALTSAFTAIGGMAAKALPAVSDIRVKTDIRQVAKLRSGIGVYSFRFRWDWTPYVGVIAQEVEKIVPEAVSCGDDGLLRVDYDHIEAPFMTLVDWKNAHQPANG